MHISKHFSAYHEWEEYSVIETIARIFNPDYNTFPLETEEKGYFPIVQSLYSERGRENYYPETKEVDGVKMVYKHTDATTGEKIFVSAPDFCEWLAEANLFDRTLWLNRSTLIAWNSREECEQCSTVMVLMISYDE